MHSVYATPVFFDSLSNNSINPAIWTTQITGTGPIVSATNQSVISTLPTNSLNDPQAQVFSGGLGSVCFLSGDFDAQVDFKLLLWPQSSGVRVGIVVTDAPTPAVERTAFGPSEALSLPREVYLAHFVDGVQGVTATSDLNGTLRIVRTGSLLSGYYHSAGGWTLIHTGPSPTTGPVHFGFRAWSHNALFGGQEVKVAFNNFTVSSGQVSCPRLSLSPTKGPIGTLVQVQVTGLVNQGFGPDQVLMSFDGNLLGIATNVNGNFNFAFNVPTAQPGIHLVTALDEFTAMSLNATFIVTKVDTLSISLDVGTLYFPGDTPAVYTLATLSGTPLNFTSVQIQLTLTRPDGSVAALNNTLVGAGLFRAVYPIPKAGPIGTYAIVAKAHVTGVQDASALATFEVKQTWLSAQGPAITTTAVALTGVAAVATAVVWRKGVFKTKNE